MLNNYWLLSNCQLVHVSRRVISPTYRRHCHQSQQGQIQSISVRPIIRCLFASTKSRSLLSKPCPLVVSTNARGYAFWCHKRGGCLSKSRWLPHTAAQVKKGICVPGRPDSEEHDGNLNALFDAAILDGLKRAHFHINNWLTIRLFYVWCEESREDRE